MNFVSFQLSGTSPENSVKMYHIYKFEDDEDGWKYACWAPIVLIAIGPAFNKKNVFDRNSSTIGSKWLERMFAHASATANPMQLAYQRLENHIAGDTQMELSCRSNLHCLCLPFDWWRSGWTSIAPCAQQMRTGKGNMFFSPPPFLNSAAVETNPSRTLSALRGSSLGLGGAGILFFWSHVVQFKKAKFEAVYFLPNLQVTVRHAQSKRWKAGCWMLRAN